MCENSIGIMVHVQNVSETIARRKGKYFRVSNSYDLNKSTSNIFVEITFPGMGKHKYAVQQEREVKTRHIYFYKKENGAGTLRIFSL